jgi:integrase
LKKSTKIRVVPLPGERNRLGRRKTAKDCEQEAMIICLAWQHAEDMAGAGTATEAQVRRVLNETLTRIGAKPMASPTVREWLEFWISTKTGIVGASTLVNYEQAARAFLQWLGKRADAKIETVTVEEITRFRDHLRDQGLSDGTIRKLIGKCPRTTSTRIRKGTFTPEQMKSLLSVADADWRGLIMLAYYTGARLQDLANLKWGNVDMTAKLIRFHQRKTGQEIAIPLHPSLERYFLNIWTPTITTDAFIFPTLAGRDEGGNSGLSRQFLGIMVAAKIDNPVIRQRKGSKGRTVRLLSFHSLRHSFVSALANLGVPQELRQLLSGHQDAQSHAVYTHTDLARLREAVEKMPGI